MADFLRDFLIGGISAAVSMTVFAPFHQVRSYQPTFEYDNKKRYKGIVDCFLKQGFAMWRGNLANVIRIFPGQALNFAFKDVYRKFFCPFDPKKEKFLFFLGNMASGSAAGATSLIVFHPLDLGRTMLDIRRNGDRQFIDLTDYFSKVYKSDGFIGLYRYFGVSVLWGSLDRGLYFGTYDTAKGTIFQHPQMGNIFAKYIVAYFIAHTADFISRPFATIERRLIYQFKTGDIRYKNTLDCAGKIAKSEGTQAFFKGPISYRGYASFVLVLYDESKQFIAQGSKSAQDERANMIFTFQNHLNIINNLTRIVKIHIQFIFFIVNNCDHNFKITFYQSSYNS